MQSDFTGRECTEMSFAPFHRIGIDLLWGDFKVCSWKQMDNSLHGLLNTICNNKSLADSRSRRNSEDSYLKKLSSGMELLE
ncbi:hypothetical protein TNCV_3548681 [Trichonephila clavipes]|nr:hypothetical protein TNCV_3548681 [Trichonephila clavipes]